MKPKIKLMADYQCWPLWHHGEGIVGNIDPQSLGLSPSLLISLKLWSEEYDSHLDLNDPAATSWTEDEVFAFDREGRRLCSALADEVGPGTEVFYFDQRTSRSIPVLELKVASPT